VNGKTAKQVSRLFVEMMEEFGVCVINIDTQETLPFQGVYAIIASRPLDHQLTPKDIKRILWENREMDGEYLVGYPDSDGQTVISILRTSKEEDGVDDLIELGTQESLDG